MVKSPTRNQRKALVPVRTTISMPAVLFAVASNKCTARGYSTLSDYLQALVRRDSGMENAT